MEYYEKIHIDIRYLFEQHDFRPNNQFEADAFLRSLYNINADKDFLVTLKTPIIKNNKTLNKIIANKNNYYDLFYPEIWSQLQMGERLQAINFAFKNIVEENTDLLKNPPQLIFKCERVPYKAAFYRLKDNRYIDISMLNIDSNEKHPLDWIATIRHELLHCQQDIMIDDISKQLVYNNKNGLKNNFNEYQLNLLFTNYDFPFSCNYAIITSKIIDTYEKFAGKNDEDLKFVKYWDTIKFEEAWQILLVTFYFVDDIEAGAIDKSADLVNKLNSYYSNNYNNYEPFKIKNAKEVFLNEIKHLNKNFGFSLKEQDIIDFKKFNQQFALNNLSYGANGTVKVKPIYPNKPEFFETKNWEVIKKILTIYKDKCIKQKLTEDEINQTTQKIKSVADEVLEM